MTSETHELNKPFDVLDAAVYKYLPGALGRGCFDFRRQEVIQHALVLYHLSQKQLGDLGTIEIRALPDNRSEMEIDGPPRPPERSMTDEEKAACHAIEDRAGRIKAELAVREKISAEAEELYRKRDDFQSKIIASLFSWMHQDDLVLSKTAGAARPKASEGDTSGQAAAKSGGPMLDFERFVAGTLLKLDSAHWRSERQTLGPVTVYFVFHDNVAVGRIQTNADGTWETGDAIPDGEHIDRDWRRIVGAIIDQYDKALESEARTAAWLKAYRERKKQAGGDKEATRAGNGKGKVNRRNRGPSRSDLESCKQAMKYWLDDAKDLQDAADLAGTTPKTVEKWILNTLETVDQDTNERWTRILKALKKLR
jgi:hypothetical protein